MKKLFTLTAAAAAATFALTSAAGATTFIFKGDGATDLPTGVEGVDFDTGCDSAGADVGSAGDICTVHPDGNAAGLNYGPKDGITVNVVAYAGIAAGESSDTSGAPTLLIQDIVPSDSGLGALSELNNVDDQTQFNAGESVKFTFNKEVFLTNIEFNDGNDSDCNPAGSEGPCGTFNLWIDGVLLAANTGITAVDLLTTVFQGTVFEFVATQAGAGFAIAAFEVNEIPIPGALPLLLSGIAGLGFASRRRKKA